MFVLFGSVDERDLVYAHARNLAKHAGSAGIRLEIPQHLRPDFKLLESHGNTIRGMMGPAVKRSIRFEDSDCSLILNIRLSPDDPWVTVSVDQAKEARRLRAQAAVAMIRTSYPGQTSQPISSQQSRALGLPPPAVAGPSGAQRRPRALGSPSQQGTDPANNPFSYLNQSKQQ